MIKAGMTYGEEQILEEIAQNEGIYLMKYNFVTS